VTDTSQAEGGGRPPPLSLIIYILSIFSFINDGSQ